MRVEIVDSFDQLICLSRRSQSADLKNSLGEVKAGIEGKVNARISKKAVIRNR